MPLPVTFTCGWRLARIFTNPNPHKKITRQLGALTQGVGDVITGHNELLVRCPLDASGIADVELPGPLKELPAKLRWAIAGAAFTGAMDLHVATIWLTYLRGILLRPIKKYIKATGLDARSLACHDVALEFIPPGNDCAPTEHRGVVNVRLQVYADFTDENGWRRIQMVGLHPRFPLSQWGMAQAASIVTEQLTSLVLGVPVVPGGDA